MTKSTSGQDDEQTTTGKARKSASTSINYASQEQFEEEEDFEQESTQVYCDALCSLGSSSAQTESDKTSCLFGVSDDSLSKRKAGKPCPKQLQLPMFLSKTYHMIDRCDQEIASWSESGDNFVVKNVEKFASHVLPLYFKHSNFSSFARQLNFYGFRKLRTDPILTSDVDPRTACYVRFYHEKFQKDKPELLQQIKRATKTDQQSKDDVDGLKHEVAKLKEALSLTTAEYDRKLAELSYECNRRITAMNAEYDKLAALVQRALGDPAAAAAAASFSSAPALPGMGVDLLRSLSQAAVSLNHLRPPAGATTAALCTQQQQLHQAVYNANGKRPPSDDTDEAKRRKTSGTEEVHDVRAV